MYALPRVLIGIAKKCKGFNNMSLTVNKADG